MSLLHSPPTEVGAPSFVSANAAGRTLPPVPTATASADVAPFLVPAAVEAPVVIPAGTAGRALPPMPPATASVEVAPPLDPAAKGTGYHFLRRGGEDTTTGASSRHRYQSTRCGGSRGTGYYPCRRSGEDNAVDYLSYPASIPPADVAITSVDPPIHTAEGATSHNTNASAVVTTPVGDGHTSSTPLADPAGRMLLWVPAPPTETAQGAAPLSTGPQNVCQKPTKLPVGA